MKLKEKLSVEEISGEMLTNKSLKEFQSGKAAFTHYLNNYQILVIII